MGGRWKYVSYKKPFARTTRELVIKLIIIAVAVAAAVFCIVKFLVPLVSDVINDRDPSERYQESVTVEFRNNTGNADTYEGAEVFDTYINEIKTNYTMKSCPFYDGKYVIFSTDDNKQDGIALNAVCLYNTETNETEKLENVTKKYDNILMTKLSGNYAVWIDCLTDGSGRICGYDLHDKQQFLIKEFGYAIPEISICGNYIAFMQVAGENEQRIYIYDLATRKNVTVQIYSNTDVTCSNVSISENELVWSEYSRDGRSVIRSVDLLSGTGERKEYPDFDDYVFEPKTNGEYILFSTKANSYEGDLMLSRQGEKPMKIASGIIDYAIGKDYAVYTKDEKIYVVSLDKPLQSQLVSGEFIRAVFASLNGNRLCFYDVTDDFGLIDSVRYFEIAKGEKNG